MLLIFEPAGNSTSISLEAAGCLLLAVFAGSSESEWKIVPVHAFVDFVSVSFGFLPDFHQSVGVF